MNNKWLARNPGFYKTLFLIAGPLILQNALSVSVGFADNIMVGQLGETSVAGVLVANQLQNIMQLLVAGGIASSLILLAAQYWGKRDIESVKAVVAVAVKVALAVGLLASIAVLYSPASVLRIFTNDEYVIAEGVLYIRIVAISYVFFCLTQILMASMRCVEVVRIAVLVSLSTLIISVALNYLLIFGNFGFPALGIRGAAIATLTARIIETVIMVVYVRFVDRRLKIRFVELIKTDRQLLADFFRYGTPIMLGDMLWGIAGSAQIAILGRMGEAALAANSISMVMFQVTTVVIWSISGASAVIIGKTVGSGDYELVKRYARSLQVVFLSVSLVTAGIILGFRDVFISFYYFTDETRIIARQFMTIMGLSIVFTGYHAPCFTGIIRAGGDVKFVLIVDAICAWLLVLPSAFLAAFIFDMPPWVVFLCLRSDQFYKWIIAFIKTNRFKWIINLTRDGKAYEL